MRSFLKTYCNIIAQSLLGIIFAFASFYLIINLYHQQEVSRTYSISFDTDRITQQFNTTLQSIENNLTLLPDNPTKNHIQKCISSLNNQVMQDIYSKQKIDIRDVYYLREAYEEEVINQCFNQHLTPLLENQSESVQKILNQEINYLRNDTSYVAKDLLNNSSFYYNTAMALTIKDNVRDGYYEVLSSYQQTALILDYLVQEEMKGVDSSL